MHLHDRSCCGDSCKLVSSVDFRYLQMCSEFTSSEEETRGREYERTLWDRGGRACYPVEEGGWEHVEVWCIPCIGVSWSRCWCYIGSTGTRPVDWYFFHPCHFSTLIFSFRWIVKLIYLLLAHFVFFPFNWFCFIHLLTYLVSSTFQLILFFTF